MKKAFIGLIVMILVIVGTYYILINTTNNKEKTTENNNKYNEVLEYTLYDKVGYYSIYEDSANNTYYIVNDLEKKVLDSGEIKEIKYYTDNYTVDSDKLKYYVYIGYLINKIDNIISSESFDDISCKNDEDNFFNLCENGNITIVTLNNKKGFLDVKTGKLLTKIKYDKVEEYTKNYFTCDDKICLYLNNMIIEQLKVYDEIKYYDNIGYIAIKNDKLKVLDDNFESVKITEEVYKKLVNIGYIKELEIDVNDYFTYKGEIKGTQSLVIVDTGCGDYDENYQIKKTEPEVYVFNRIDNKLSRLDPNLIETNIAICDYFINPYKYKTVEKKQLSEFKISEEEVENIKTADKYDIYMNFLTVSDNEIKDLYVIQYDNNHNPERGYNGIYNKKEGYIIEPYYNDVSCYFHTDESYRVCENSYTTLIDLKNLLSLKTGEILVETDGMNEISNGNFIGIKNGKNIVYSSEGKELLKADYIGYNNKVGYITIENNELKVYNEKFKSKALDNLNEINLENAYNNWIINNNMIVDVDIKNNEYFEYKGELSGTKKVLIFPCTDKQPTYIIEGNKITKLDNITKNDDGCF